MFLLREGSWFFGGDTNGLLCGKSFLALTTVHEALVGIIEQVTIAVDESVEMIS